jgi:hypothetical protein
MDASGTRRYAQPKAAPIRDDAGVVCGERTPRQADPLVVAAADAQLAVFERDWRVFAIGKR